MIDYLGFFVRANNTNKKIIFEYTNLYSVLKYCKSRKLYGPESIHTILERDSEWKSINNRTIIELICHKYPTGIFKEYMPKSREEISLKNAFEYLYSFNGMQHMLAIYSESDNILYNVLERMPVDTITLDDLTPLLEKRQSFGDYDSSDFIKNIINWGRDHNCDIYINQSNTIINPFESKYDKYDN